VEFLLGNEKAKAPVRWIEATKAEKPASYHRTYLKAICIAATRIKRPSTASINFSDQIPSNFMYDSYSNTSYSFPGAETQSKNECGKFNPAGERMDLQV